MHILIVEDNRNLASGLQHNLEMEGHVVQVAHDGATGLVRAQQPGVDLIILDLMLPKPDGYQILRTLRESGIETPVIVLTARGEEADKVRGFRLGADDYVTKPFGLLELLARVDAIRRRIRLGGAATTAKRPLPTVVEFGTVRVDPATRTVERDGRTRLTPPEGVRPAARARAARWRGRVARGSPRGSLGVRLGGRVANGRYPRQTASAQARARPECAETHPDDPEDGLSAEAVIRSGDRVHAAGASRRRWPRCGLAVRVY